jgi:hypothetical protein
MKNFLGVFGTVLLFGCVTGQEVRNSLHEGMPKSEVISILGNPDGFKRSGDYEALVYTDRLISGWSWNRADYTVILKNDRVIQYGTGQVRQEASNVLVIVPTR